MKSISGKLFWALLTVIPTLGIIFSLTDPIAFQAERGEWQEWIGQFGVLGPAVFVLIQIIQVVVTPISHYTVGVIGGFLYGPWLGGLLNWIGRVAGHSIAFYLSRRYGRSLMNRFIDESTRQRFDRLVGGNNPGSVQLIILFLIFFLPFFPDDEISYIVGLSRMPFRSFIIAALLGHTGGALSLAYAGSGIDTNDFLFWFLTVVTLMGFPVIWLLLRRRGANTEE